MLEGLPKEVCRCPVRSRVWRGVGLEPPATVNDAKPFPHSSDLVFRWLQNLVLPIISNEGDGDVVDSVAAYRRSETRATPR